jgi:anti-sigma B factor antagonist
MFVPVRSTHMSIKIDEREHQSITWLVVAGRMTTSECRGVLKSAVMNLIERGRKQVVIDLEAVPFMDSSGLGELVSSYASLKRMGGSLTLANVNRKIVEMFDATGLTPVLPITDLPQHVTPRS